MASTIAINIFFSKGEWWRGVNYKIDDVISLELCIILHISKHIMSVTLGNNKKILILK